MKDKYPVHLTSYDLIKSLALILMICDHVGYFFYPEEMWFRVMGRICLPVWFFLIGFAKTDKVPKSFWIGGAIVAASSLISGQYIFPFNILFTLAFLRMYRAGVVRHALVSGEALRGMFLIMFFLSFPTSILVEYGSLGMIIVLVGIIARYKEEVYKQIEKKYAVLYAVIAFFSFYIVQGAMMPSLSSEQALVMLAGYMVVGYTLWNFRPAVYVDANRFMAPSIISILKFLGRRTLEIYVVHLVVFKGVVMYLDPERFPLLQWQFFHEKVLMMFN